jgi:hypothetical protein
MGIPTPLATFGLDVLDDLRRSAGRLLDTLGHAPRTTPSAVVDLAPGVRLHTYPDADPSGPPVLLVPAPIKRCYIFDLDPRCSVVARCLRHGLQPHLVEWTDPEPDQQRLGHRPGPLPHRHPTRLCVSPGCLAAAAGRACTLSAVSSEFAAPPVEDTTGWPPRQSRVATAALVLGVLAIPFGLLVYPGLLLGVLAVGFGVVGLTLTGRGRALGRARAAAGLVAGLVALAIAGSLLAQGLSTIRDCEARVGHRPGAEEIEQCIRDGL